ncbi:anhydro-N-acetylmuramic acid kinase [Nocardioides nanhaiensis]|uniref:Anhydro-N-acetylmuramic acid kinase n=1 Tax=Nocardioides nanhaiensis TaxID=1476871 RepID=A0ABP8X2Z7_9ACTN
MIVVSVASGTSADGIDVGVVGFGPAGGEQLEVEVLDARTAPWPRGLRERLLALLPPGRTTAAELCSLDTEVGQALAAVAATACRWLADRGATADLVVSPGQTVHHEVVDGHCLGTLQIGQPAWIAEATGLPVLSDLRARDVAGGGHGAPLAGVLDALWLGPVTAGPRVAVNLGGIANLSVVTSTGVEAWDTGPANCLLDVAAARASAGRLTHDVDGALAAAGTCDPALLDRLRAHPFLRAAPPKSTGRETFSESWLDGVLDAHLLDGVLTRERRPLRWPDVLATLVELTASTVAEAVTPRGPAEVVVSGGGARNPVLMAALGRHLDGVPVVTSEHHGLPADGKESVLWALLGWLAWHGVPVTTGEHRPRVPGRFSPGAHGLGLPPPLAAATWPVRLSVRACGGPGTADARDERDEYERDTSEVV